VEEIFQLYRRLDDWAWGLSRVEYAIFTGIFAAFGSLAVSMVLEDPDYAFAIGIGFTLTVFYYVSNPNQKEE
jgi:hypothetical protein